MAGEYKHHFVPCVFSLLTNKDTESYIFVLNELKIRGVNPSKVHGDFEAGEIAAINEVWPNAEVSKNFFKFLYYINLLRLYAANFISPKRCYEKL